MKKNSIFSFKLYREALRQIRVCAIVPLVFMVIALGISFSESCIEAVQNPQLGQNVAEPTQINPLLIVTFLICAPLLTFVLFNFLNKRNQSDFYHAIPHPRQCVAISFLAAIFTWIVIYAVVPTLCGAMLYRFFLFKHFTVDMSLVLSGMLNVIVLSMLIVAAIFLAMTVTGTLFSNGIVALLILFLPRFFMTVINATFAYDIIPASSLAFPLGPFNMLFNLLFGAGVDGNGGGLYPFNGWALLYTSVLAILYLALGLFLFKRRPSEAAGNPAPSRKTQAFHRIVLTCAIAFPLTLLLISEPPTSPEEILLYIIGYIVAVVVYFMYELLSTRTVRYMVKIIPGLLIVVAACIAGVLLSKGFYGILLNDIPKADEVKCIYIEKLGERYEVEDGSNLFDYNTRYYFDEKLGELEVTDKECIRITTKMLAQSVNELKKPNPALFPDQYWAKIKFVCKNGHKVTRLIPIVPNVEDFTTLQNALKAHPDYKKVYTNLPAFKDSFATALWGNSASDIFTVDQRRDLYNTLRDELKTVDADKWVAIFTNDSGAASYDCPAFLTLQVSIPQNGKTMIMTVPICTLTPKTLESAQKIIYANFQPEDFKKAMRLPDSYGMNEFNSMNWIIRLSLYQDSGVTERLEFSPSVLMYTNDGEKVEMTAEEKAAKIKKWNDAIDYFAAHNTPAFDMTNGCVEIWAEYYVFDGIGKGYKGAVFLPLDGDTLPKELFGLADFLEYSTNIYGEEIVEDGETVESTELPADFGSTTATATAVSEQTKPAA